MTSWPSHMTSHLQGVWGAERTAQLFWARQAALQVNHCQCWDQPACLGALPAPWAGRHPTVDSCSRLPASVAPTLVTDLTPSPPKSVQFRPNPALQAWSVTGNGGSFRVAWVWGNLHLIQARLSKLTLGLFLGDSVPCGLGVWRELAQSC